MRRGSEPLENLLGSEIAMDVLNRVGNRRRRVLAAATAAVVILLAVAGPAPAVAAEEPPVGTLDRGGRLDLELHSRAGADARRRGRPPAETSGAFVYRKGRYIPLNAVPGATFGTLTVAINSRGETAGSSVDAAPGNDGQLPPGSVNGFVRNRRGDTIKFAGPRGENVAVFGLNNRGQTTGVYTDTDAVPGPDGVLPPGAVHGFVRDRNGRIATFDVPFPYLHGVLDINDRGQTVGFYDTPSGPGGGFLRDPDGQITPIDVPGAGPFTFPFAVNDRGQVVGYYADEDTTLNPDGSIPPYKVHGFVWDEGRFRSFDVTDALATFPYGINNRGQIVGGYFDAAGKQHGFLLTRGDYQTLDAPGRVDGRDNDNDGDIDKLDVATIAWDINDRGEILINEPGATNGGFQVSTD
jgi:probable HAF family extracellular repeat protein